MKKLIFTVIVVLSCISCEGNKKIREKGKETNLVGVSEELKKDSIFTKFIGYQIVKRDGENQFFYNDFKFDSNTWEAPVLYEDEGTKLPNQTKLFFEKYPEAKTQFDIMKKLGIRAVLSYNYNPEAKRLESDENVGYEFDKYKLTFILSDSIEISTINFSYDDYMQIKSQYSEVTEKLDTNWFVLKRK